MTKEEIIASFDPNAPGRKESIFGLPFTPDNSEIVLVPVPWEVTASYGTGTAQAPAAILHASVQVEHYIKGVVDPWKLGVSMLPIPAEIASESDALRTLVAPYLDAFALVQGADSARVLTAKINEASENLNVYVKNTALRYLSEGKVVGVVGGDHSTPLGLLRALGEKHERFGILQIDAHADLRKAYEGFTCSHGSIMFNALKIPSVNRIVQIGVRDFCEEEVNVITRAMGRVKVFFEEDIRLALDDGKSWKTLCDEMIRELPPLVYISFDIDGLDPKLCPHTGTPVPGGFEFHQITTLLKQLAASGRKIVGFDLCEVGATEWDANVAARILYQLCAWTGISQSKLKTTA